MKKTLTSLLLGVSVISLAPTTHASFNDMVFGHKNTQAIEFLQETEVIGGYEDGSFKPGNDVNRAELTKILVEAQGITPDADQYNNCFSDVTDEWFAPYVCYAKELEWVDGYEDGSFKPEKTVNKVEAIKMVINSQGFENEMAECTEELYEDTDEDAWYAKFLCVAKAKGLLEEDENGEYVPAEGMTRAGIAENIYRSVMVRKLDKAAYSDEIASQVDEVKAEFKADREAVKESLDAAKAEIEQMREDGSSEEEIKAARQALWEEIKTAQKENRESFQESIQTIREEFKENKDAIKAKVKDCRDQGLVYRVDSDSCEERPACEEDDSETGSGSSCADSPKQRMRLQAK